MPNEGESTRQRLVIRFIEKMYGKPQLVPGVQKVLPKRRLPSVLLFPPSAVARGWGSDEPFWKWNCMSQSHSLPQALLRKCLGVQLPGVQWGAGGDVTWGGQGV